MIYDKKILAIIPARAGSKRLPGKNIMILDGCPLIAYTINAAKRSKLIDRIIVSTDSPEIAEISNRYGAETPFLRPADLSSDFSTSDDVILHTLKWLKDIEQKEYEIIPDLKKRHQTCGNSILFFISVLLHCS